MEDYGDCMNVNSNGCPFCNEFNGRKELSYFENVYGKRFGVFDRCLFKTELFVCVPTIGSFVPGYVLVIPKKHFLSFLGMPDSYLQECQTIIDRLAAHYQLCYQSQFILFEHGTADNSNPGGMSVVHAHIHLLPCNIDIIENCHEFQFSSFSCLVDVIKFYRANGDNRPYLLLRDSNKVYYLSFSSDIPSQFFRKRVCDVIGKPRMGDWKMYPFIENLKTTISNAQQYKI